MADSQYQGEMMVHWIWREPGESHVGWPRQGEIVAGGLAWLRVRVGVRVSILSGSSGILEKCIVVLLGSRVLESGKSEYPRYFTLPYGAH